MKTSISSGKAIKSIIGLVLVLCLAGAVLGKIVIQSSDNDSDISDAKLQHEMGNKYFYGDGDPGDLVKAAEWYRKAAEQGYADAQYMLGIFYFNGLGVPEDVVKAVEWYRKAAEQGHPGAQLYLGWCYEDGTGVNKDLETAIKWYCKAAEQGNESAQYAMGLAYAKYFILFKRIFY